MQKHWEPQRSHIITEQWELCEWQEEMRVSSDDSCESVMPLATRVMQAHAGKAFLTNSSEILETAI